MKRIFVFLIGLALLVPAGFADGGPLAVVYKKDGRAWRLILMGNDGTYLTGRTEKLSEVKQIALADIDRLDIQNGEYDENSVRRRFNEADYTAVITALEPVLTSSADFMGIRNNLHDAFNLLMQAYHENGDVGKAREASSRLMETSNPELKCSAQVCRVLAALAGGDLKTAEAVQAEISDPAAKLYARACVERARQKPETAIQTAVELIAEHPNDLNWMPRTELLCAELYLEMGMTASAGAAARQTQKLYAGTNTGKEAQALRSILEQSTEQPEE